MFIIEEKNVLSEIIGKVKARYEKEFNIFNEFFGYEKILSEFDVKEVTNNKLLRFKNQIKTNNQLK